MQKPYTGSWAGKRGWSHILGKSLLPAHFLLGFQTKNYLSDTPTTQGLPTPFGCSKESPISFEKEFITQAK